MDVHEDVNECEIAVTSIIIPVSAGLDYSDNNIHLGIFEIPTSPPFFPLCLFLLETF